jgi:hypothetical protein
MSPYGALLLLMVSSLRRPDAADGIEARDFRVIQVGLMVFVVVAVCNNLLLEATNADPEEFGRERLAALLREYAQASHEVFADQLLRAVQQWSAAQEDDLTVVVCDFCR